MPRYRRRRDEVSVNAITLPFKSQLAAVFYCIFGFVFTVFILPDPVTPNPSDLSVILAHINSIVHWFTYFSLSVMMYGVIAIFYHAWREYANYRGSYD